MYKFEIPPVVITGPGASEQVGKEAKKLSARKALLVTDKGIAKLGYAKKIATSLEAEGIACFLFDGVTPDPTLQNVQDGLAIYRAEGCDIIIGLGGGSSIDCGKGIAVSATNDGELADYMGVDKIPKFGAPLIAIPTTAGTGSEVTKVVVITDTERNVKMMLSSPCLLARVALVDPMLSLTTPPSLTAAVGVDALAHAIEAYVSKRAQPITDAIALAAIRLIAQNLRQAWADGSNLEARKQMMVAATMAGMAFSNSSVALVHGMARPIGAYFHIHHGLSNAVLLLEVMKFSLPDAQERYAQIAEAMGERCDGKSASKQALNEAKGRSGSSEAAVCTVQHLLEELQIPRLGELGIDKEKFESVVEQMAVDALASGSPANNPRPATQEQIVTLYRRCW